MHMYTSTSSFSFRIFAYAVFDSAFCPSVNASEPVLSNYGRFIVCIFSFPEENSFRNRIFQIREISNVSADVVIRIYLYVYACMYVGQLHR